VSNVWWPLVAGGALWMARDAFTYWLAHQLRLKEAAESDRLAKLEREVQMLVQAQNVRGMGR
jgi:hypothetical protein